MRIINGMDARKYANIHQKNRRSFGKASKCEMPDCPGTSKRFEWAVKKGRQYSLLRDDYMELCISCHRKYDFSEDHRSKKREGFSGSKNIKAELSENDVLEIYLLLAGGLTVREIYKHFRVSDTAVYDIKRGRTWSHLYNNQDVWKYKKVVRLSESDINDIAHSNKSSLDLAETYRIDRAHVYRIRSGEHWSQITGIPNPKKQKTFANL